MVYQRIYDLLVEKQNQQIEEGFLTRFRTGFRNPDKPRGDTRVVPMDPTAHAVVTGRLAHEPTVFDVEKWRGFTEKMPQHQLRQQRLAKRDALRDKLQASYADSRAPQREILTRAGVPVPRKLALIPRIRRGLSSAFNFRNRQRGLA